MSTVLHLLLPLRRDFSKVAAPLAVLANVVASLPAHADAGKIFDFNLTLPLMAGQFLLLMVFLDKTWFTPVGKVLDERDGKLRSKLALVRDNGGELEKLQAEAENVLKAARADAAARVQAAKSKTSAEQGEKLAAAKAKIDAELSAAIKALEDERAAAMQSLDASVNKLSDDILTRILPQGLKA